MTCESSKDAISRLESAESIERRAELTKTEKQLSPKAAEGKRTLDTAMEPIRRMKAEEETATGARHAELVEELNKHYSDTAVAMEKATPEKKAVTQALQADSNVKKYIEEMDLDEYANLRQELQTTFGGPQARLAEIMFKDTHLANLEKTLSEKGLYTNQIGNEFATMKSSGILTDRDFNKLRVLEEYAKKGTDVIQPGSARGTYASMKANLGEELTQEIFSKKFGEQLEKLTPKLEELSRTDKLFKKGLTKDEERILEEWQKGTRKIDGNTIEVMNKIAEKISNDTWDAIKGTIKPLDELDVKDRAKVIGNTMGKEGNLLTRNEGKLIGLGATGVALLFGIPQSLVWYVTTTPTNIAEMMALYQQFQDKDVEDLERSLLCDDCIKNINELLDKINNMEDWPILKTLLAIPIYGDYIRSYLEWGLTDNPAAITKNMRNMYGDLEDMGLVKKADNTLGYEKTTPEEREKIYAEDPTKLFKTKDEKYIEEYGNKIWGDMAFDASETPDGRPMSGAQAMIYYMSLMGKESAEYGSDLGVSDRTKGWEQNNPSFVEKVIGWGNEQTEKTKREAGASSVDEMREVAIQNAMKREGLTREQAEKRVNEEVGLLVERGSTEKEALEKLTGMGGGAGGAGGVTGGGAGGGAGGGTEETLETKARKKYAEGLVKGKKMTELSDNERDIVTKELSFKEVKNTNPTTTLGEYTDGMSQSKKKEVVKEHVSENHKSMSKDEIIEAKDIDKAATAAAILDAACGE